MFIPEKPILYPKPKLVKCPNPKCNGNLWYWRTWWKRDNKLVKNRTTCTSCKVFVVPIVVDAFDITTLMPGGGIGIRLIKCSKCGNLQWYNGTKMKTSCTNITCLRKNIDTIPVTYGEVEDIITKAWDAFTEDEQEYYSARLKELRGEVV